MTGIEPALFEIFKALVIGGGTAWFVRGRTKAETGSLVVSQFQALATELRQDINRIKAEEKERREDLLIKAKELEDKVDDNKKKLKEYEQNLEDADFELGITRLQLNKALLKLEMTHWVKASVFVLDDSKIVIDVFTHRFKTIPVVHFKPFVDPMECIMEAKRERPEILVLDYTLSDEMTAEDVIKEIGYEPEIFIMSGTKENELRFKDTDIKFFYKDKFYIKNITKAILEFLIKKNQ